MALTAYRGGGLQFYQAELLIFQAAVLIQFFAVEGKKLARSEILSNQCLELDVRQRKRFCGGAEI